jgi:hypothetical protein
MLSLRKTTKKSAWLPPTYSILHSIEHYQLWGEILSIFMSTVVFSQPFPSHLSVVAVSFTPPHSRWMVSHSSVSYLFGEYILPYKNQTAERRSKQKKTLNMFKCIPPLWKAVSRQMTGYTLPERFAIWHHQTVVDYILFSLQLSPPCLFLQWVYTQPCFWAYLKPPTSMYLRI